MIGVVDAFGGLAGDMFLGALVDAGAPVDALRETLASLELAGWGMQVEPATRRSLGCTSVRFAREDGDVERAHRHLPEILARIEASTLSPMAKVRAVTAFETLARAEAKVHRVPVEQVHFHETGAADAILDICGVCEALVRLGVDRLFVLPMPAGSGTVTCEHGELPCPVPAVTELLAGWPLRIGEGVGEMITPTAACLLRAWGEPLRDVTELGALRIAATGYGAGSRARSIARIMLGSRTIEAGEDASTDAIWELRTHVDDIGGDQLAFVVERLMSVGALDVAVAPVLMKKGRPAHALTIMAPDEPAKRDALVELLFRHTTTLGVRRQRIERHLRARTDAVVETAYGPVRVKRVGDRLRPEHEVCARLALQFGVTLQTIYDAVRDAGRNDES